jgi:hypothetical protein
MEIAAKLLSKRVEFDENPIDTHYKQLNVHLEAIAHGDGKFVASITYLQKYLIFLMTTFKIRMLQLIINIPLNCWMHSK